MSLMEFWVGKLQNPPMKSTEIDADQGLVLATIPKLVASLSPLLDGVFDVFSRSNSGRAWEGETDSGVPCCGRWKETAKLALPLTNVVRT